MQENEIETTRGARAPLRGETGRDGFERTADLVVGVIEARLGARGDVGRETPLFEGGLDLDSIDFLELLLDLERVCGRRLRDETLTEAAVADVGSLIAYVHALDHR